MNLSSALSSNTYHPNNTLLPREPYELHQPSDNREKVIILHDSLCGKINETILSRENVKTKKIWAPNFEEMEKTLDEIEHTEVIVVQAFTRDLDNLEVNEMNDRINEIVIKALTKAQKVVVNTIVNREDIQHVGVKAELVNARIKYMYLNHENVLVCDNRNLNDSKFRVRDGLHLTTHGTSILATNLKYKIAEALNIKVIKKDGAYRNRKYNNNYRSFFRDNNG